MLCGQCRGMWAFLFLLLGDAVTGSAVTNVVDAKALLRAGNYQELDAYYSGVQGQFRLGKISGDQLRDEFRAFYPTDSDLAAKFDSWVNADPGSYVARLARGIYFKKLGDQERGTKYISETSQSQIDKMDDAMTKATRDLGASIEMDPKPFLSYFYSLDIARHYASNERSRKLFDRAAQLDPNSFGLRTKFMSVLEPQWGGSAKEMRAFLEECKKTKLSPSNLRELESRVYEAEGFEYHAVGNLAAAEAAYRNAIGLAPCSLCIYNALNKVLFESHRYQAVITLLDEYLQQKPGDLWALANRGSAKLAAKRPLEAVEDWRPAAEAGDSYSQDHLGMLYLTGFPDTLDANLPKSIYWLRKAAEQGEAEAQANLPRAVNLAAHPNP
jgi:tetratricopeptide (TPR) repeat protein